MANASMGLSSGRAPEFEVNAVIRKAAVAGSWYPGSRAAIEATVDRYLGADTAGTHAPRPTAAAGDLVALIAPHAGLMYSGPVAAYAYRLLRDTAFDTIVLVGPSHFVAFDGISIWPAGGFETPLGLARIDEGLASAIADAEPLVGARPDAHLREHSLEMQLPFVQRLAPAARIVPLVMGRQTGETSQALGRALGTVLRGRRALLVASTDLSHFHDAATASRLDAVVIDHVARLDAEGLQHALAARPDHACGGGPTVAVMMAARELGADRATILNYGDSGDVSGDKRSVVGYLAACLRRGRDT